MIDVREIIEDIAEGRGLSQRVAAVIVLVPTALIPVLVCLIHPILQDYEPREEGGDALFIWLGEMGRSEATLISGLLILPVLAIFAWIARPQGYGYVDTLPKPRSHCAWCKYDLRGLDRPRCPECGRYSP